MLAWCTEYAKISHVVAACRKYTQRSACRVARACAHACARARMGVRMLLALYVDGPTSSNNVHVQVWKLIYVDTPAKQLLLSMACPSAQPHGLLAVALPRRLVGSAQQALSQKCALYTAKVRQRLDMHTHTCDRAQAHPVRCQCLAVYVVSADS